MSLTNNEINRYSRQLIIPDFGIESQLKLKNSSALIIGCGGLGCPVGLYLSSAGIGRLGLVDNDVIEISNIHRQIAHDLNNIGSSKSKNLANKCKQLNDLVIYEPYECLFDKQTGQEMIKKYDIVLDCTDNVITRYLINDLCVLLNKPLVSGSALKLEGQLTVYNHLNSPCYRCLYPKAPLPETVSNCSDAGILGPIVGMIGSLQALEAIKILANIGTTLNGRMLIFDGLDFQTRVIKLRPKQAESCLMCKNVVNQTLTDIEVQNILNTFDYNQFCGVINYNDKSQDVIVLNETQRIACEDYSTLTSNNHLLIDVRPKTQFNICSLPNSLNIPYDDFLYNQETTLENVLKHVNNLNTNSIYVVCRRGNDSQFVVEMLEKYFIGKDFTIKDLIGGLQAWSNQVDQSFPKY